ncbi:CBL-interacting serine threonine- kinase 7-like [Olea europaea subsp. europaea]|uniref:CBL-interacting serine threonine- kinase 7-like n=1 Tax=Olea europaea subsp. europaea TaxID=158383 RepID=A0A8S0UER6_OLEEU|nr:CBL-interacting serine threonine- kinase 7-like [Olea europaea subsp. europaea]
MEPCIVREVSAMRCLDHHPNILKLPKVMATRTKIYLVVDLVPGNEFLAKLKCQRRFSESMTRYYFHQLVSGLLFYHQNDIAHCNIKPQNLFLDNKGSLKIINFGLSALSKQKMDGLLLCGI